MRALAAVQGVVARDENDILDHLLSRERHFWINMIRARSLPDSLVEGVSRAMAAITLKNGSGDMKQTLEILNSLTLFHGHTEGVLTQVAQLLHGCYPGIGASPDHCGIAPLTPPLLGEHLVRCEQVKGSDDITGLMMTGPI